MNTELILKQLNNTVDTWVNGLNDYTLIELCTKPAEDSWSLGQVYLHIIDQTENFYIRQIERCLSSNENSEEEMTNDARKFLDENSFPDERIKSPSNFEMPQPSDIEELRKELLTIRKSLNDIGKAIRISEFRGKAEHPGWRFLTASEWLQFIDMHLRHHLKQKKRIDPFLGKIVL